MAIEPPEAMNTVCRDGSPASDVATGKRSKALQGSVPVPAHGLARGNVSCTGETEQATT